MQFQLCLACVLRVSPPDIEGASQVPGFFSTGPHDPHACNHTSHCKMTHQQPLHPQRRRPQDPSDPTYVGSNPSPSTSPALRRSSLVPLPRQDSLSTWRFTGSSKWGYGVPLRAPVTGSIGLLGFRGSYKCGSKSPNMGYNYSYPTYSPRITTPKP